MKRITKSIGIDIFTFNELPEAVKELFKLAVATRNNAQAPYSDYHVGCAIVTEDGRVFSGVNVERCSWTQTSHAKQNAIDSMITNAGPVALSAVVVVGGPANKDISFGTPPLPPEEEDRITRIQDVCPSCGHCLQIIVENCFKTTGEYNPNVTLWGYHNGEFYCTTIGEALPMPFVPQHLGVNYTKK